MPGEKPGFHFYQAHEPDKVALQTNKIGGTGMDKGHKGFSDYIQRVVNAAGRHCLEKDGIYATKEGAERFARECGPALLDFDDSESLVSRTYSGICVRAYDLKPPIDAKEWNKNIVIGMNRARR